MPDPRTQIVADGYDAMGETFATWREEIVGDPRREWEDDLAARLEPGARVLELGCGGGTPETRRLAERFALTGVDISPRQVERARAGIPEAEFLCADFTELELPAGSFDAVCSFYVFNHVPRELLAPLLAKIHGWLVPGSWLLATFGASDLPEWTGEWLGAETFFSGFPPEVNSRLVREGGFAFEQDEVVEFEEPDGPARFQWVLARRDGASFPRPGGTRSLMETWTTLKETLAAACEEPDEETAERAVRAAELVAATSGEPPDDLSDEDREWAEMHGIPPTELVDLACRSMKCVAALSDDWHERLNDLRYRLGDVAAA